MNKKYGGKGLEVISVTLDSPSEKEAIDSCLKFLKGQGATFPNFALDEPIEVLNKKLRIESVPYVFVFNRQGKYKAFDGGEEIGKAYAHVEKLVVEWLKQK